MALRVDNIDASWLVATLPERGNWGVLAELVGVTAPAKGDRVEVLVGDLVLSGTILDAGVHAGVASAYVVGGAGRWDVVNVERRPYASSSGVRLAEVAEHLAAAAGEEIVLEADVAETALGPAWTRPSGLAIDALNDLGVPWWVAPDGVTHLGTRPLVARSARFGVEGYDPATGRAVLVSPDDAVAAAQPGSSIDVEGVHLDVRACTVRASASRLAIEVHHGAVERLARLLETLQSRSRRRAQLAGIHLCRVQLQQEGLIFAQAIRTGTIDLPDEPALSVAYGMQGVTQLVRLGEEVLVAFEGGDLGHPIVVGWRGGPALRTSIDATLGMELGASLDPAAVVSVGGGARPVAMGDAVATWASFAHVLLQAIVTHLAPGPGPLTAAAAAEQAAYTTANGLGWESTALETR